MKLSLGFAIALVVFAVGNAQYGNPGMGMGGMGGMGQPGMGQQMPGMGQQMPGMGQQRPGMGQQRPNQGMGQQMPNQGMGQQMPNQGMGQQMPTPGRGGMHHLGTFMQSTGSNILQRLNLGVGCNLCVSFLTSAQQNLFQLKAAFKFFKLLLPYKCASHGCDVGTFISMKALNHSQQVCGNLPMPNWQLSNQCNQMTSFLVNQTTQMLQTTPAQEICKAMKFCTVPKTHQPPQRPQQWNPYGQQQQQPQTPYNSNPFMNQGQGQTPNRGFTPNQGYGQGGYGQPQQGYGGMFGRKRRSLDRMFKNIVPNVMNHFNSFLDHLDNTMCKSCEKVVDRIRDEILNEDTLRSIGSLLRDTCDVMPCINKTECYTIAEHYPEALKEFASSMLDTRETCESFHLCGPNSRISLSGGFEIPGFGLGALFPQQVPSAPQEPQIPISYPSEPDSGSSVFYTNGNGRKKRQVPGMNPGMNQGMNPGMNQQTPYNPYNQQANQNLLDLATMLDQLLRRFGIQIPGLGELGRRMQMLKTGGLGMPGMGGGMQPGMQGMGGGMPQGFGRKKRAAAEDTSAAADAAKERVVRQAPGMGGFNPMYGGQTALDFIPMLDRLLKSFGISIPGLDMLGRQQQMFKFGRMGMQGMGMRGFGRRKRDTHLEEVNVDPVPLRKKRQMGMGPMGGGMGGFGQQFPQFPQQQQPQQEPSWFNIPAMLDSILKRFGINIPGLKNLMGGGKQQQQPQFPGMGGMGGMPGMGMGGMDPMGGMGGMGGMGFGRKKRAAAQEQTVPVEPEDPATAELARCIGNAVTNDTWQCQLCKKGMVAMANVLDIQMHHQTLGLQSMCRFLPRDLRVVCERELRPVRRQGDTSVLGDPTGACQGLGFCLDEPDQRLP